MTRINCVPASELSRQHLIAEYRELPRVFSLARVCHDAPAEYTLGKGHVKFFYNKLLYLANRQRELVAEMRRRGYYPQFDPQQLHAHWYAIKPELFGDWAPTAKALQINRDRILERS